MTVRPLYSFAGRFVLPLALLVAAIGAWLFAGRLETVERALPSGATALSPAAPLASIGRIPELAVATSNATRLAETLGRLPADPGGLSCVRLLVDGRVVLDLRGDRALVPSYAQLFLTGHAAIDLLGPDYRYTTQLLATELPDINGRIFDGAYLDGGGDPVLMSHNYAFGFRPVHSTRTAIEDLAANVAAAGVLRIDGGVIAIERRYDDQRVLPGWPAEYSTNGTVGPLSALQLDDGFAERAAANLGVAVPSEQPATMAAERFADELWDLDVQVFDTIRTLGPDEELPTLVVVAQIASPPLRDIVFQTLAVNDATAAEMIVKELGVTVGGEGSTQAGARAVQQVLQDQGVDVAVPFRDGSGLDPFGGTSCEQLAMAADTIADGHPTLDVLPAHDLPGVFDGRFAAIEVEADLRLVGGIAGDAAGFVARTVDDGPRVTIASIINRPGGPNAADLAYKEALVELVDALRVSPTLVDLGLGE